MTGFFSSLGGAATPTWAAAGVVVLMLLKMTAGDKAGPRQECASSLQFYGRRRERGRNKEFLKTGVIGDFWKGREKKREGTRSGTGWETSVQVSLGRAST